MALKPNTVQSGFYKCNLFAFISLVQ